MLKLSKPRLALIIGLPGSGKTEFIMRSFPRAAHFDDVLANHAALAPNGLFGFVKVLRRKVDIVAGDSSLASKGSYDMFYEVLDPWIHRYDVLEVYFENDVEQCRRNVIARGRYDTNQMLRMIDELAPGYHIPVGAEVMPVWRPET